MIKRLSLLLAAAASLVACGTSPTAPSTTSSSAAPGHLGTLSSSAAYPSYLAGKDLKFFQDKLGNPNIKSVLIVHYHRFDGDYNLWNAFTFIQGVEGFATDFTEDDPFGKVAIVGSTNAAPQRGFIIRKGEWLTKDTPDDRFVDMPASGLGEVWVVSGQKAFYTDPGGIDLGSAAQIAFMDTPTQIKVSYNVAPANLTRDKLNVSIGGVPQTVSSLSQDGRFVTLTLSSPLKPEDASKLVTVSGQGVRSPLTVYLRGVLASDTYTTSERRLGAAYSPAQTTFKVWSPVSKAVSVSLFNAPTDAAPFQTVPLTRGDKGVWSGAAGGNLAGKFYLLNVDSYGMQKTTADPYGTAASNYFETQPLNQRMSAIVDLGGTNPAGWSSDPRAGDDQVATAGTVSPPSLRRATDANVYELHIRDFTVSPSSGVDPDKRGTYLGLVQPGTTLPGTNVPTGLDHLKQLGVNTVQLLPTFDYANQREGAYNWGYAPVFYNAPEAGYSTQPNDPAATVREFKTMVRGLHAAGLNVVMDVVYNHTSGVGERSPFDQVVPYYYYRTDDDGNQVNDSGTGNTFAAERPMARQFIIDSLRYWVSEYHIQGFRFDLLGTMKPEDVKAVSRAVREGNPNVVLYGEPWTGGGPIYFGKGAQKGLNIGVFNDNFRNGIIGGVFDIGTQGYIQGAFGLAPAVQSGLNGSINDFTQDPGESVNYVTSHDNFVLWDRLTLGASAARSEATRKQMQKLAAALVQTAQGLPFMTGGEELARSKGGDGNSYESPDSVNQFDWTRLNQFGDVNAYYSNIIKLRRAHPAFRYSRRADVQASYTPLPLDGSKGLVGFTLNGERAEDRWQRILVIFNANEADQKVTLPGGNWNVMVKGDSFAPENKPFESAAGSYTVPRLSMLIAVAGAPLPAPPSAPMPALRGAFRGDTTDLSEFDPAGCSSDATPGTPWGAGNTLSKVCVAQDAASLYLGLSYRVTDDNTLMTFLGTDQGGPVTDLLNLNSWKRNVQFTVGVAPSFFLVHNPGYNILALQQIQDSGGTVSNVIPQALSPVTGSDGQRYLKVKFEKALLGTSSTLTLSSAIVGGENWGGAVILPQTGNTASGPTASQIQILAPLRFSYTR